MNLDEIAPIIEAKFKKALEERRYPFGFGKYKGLSNKVASGSLRNSVTVTADSTGDGIDTLAIAMNNYGQWVQSGRLPGKKGVPIDAIEKWIKQRGLKGRDKKGRFITNRSFAFGIQKNIKKFGIKPSNWYDVAIESILEDTEIINLLGEQTVEDLINAIEGI
jgi:hypothetical protein